MRDLSESADENLDPASLECLKKTRSGVLNVLVGVGMVVALSGMLLRGRVEDGVPNGFSHTMYGGLILIFATSTIARRSLGRRSWLRDPSSRGARFFRGHVLAAAIGALAAPLGLVFGWLASPRLEAILPFWITALVLGILAYPRGYELDGFDAPMPPARGPA
jgi:hypothetical protein